MIVLTLRYLTSVTRPPRKTDEHLPHMNGVCYLMQTTTTAQRKIM